jgi:hypothetical protein
LEQQQQQQPTILHQHYCHWPMLMLLFDAYAGAGVKAGSNDDTIFSSGFMSWILPKTYIYSPE